MKYLVKITYTYNNVKYDVYYGKDFRRGFIKANMLDSKEEAENIRDGVIESYKKNYKVVETTIIEFKDKE